jgi:small-conductance mechanosensitive channel
MEKEISRKKKAVKTFIVVVYLLAFYWFFRNTTQTGVQIFMGAMGLLLLIGLIDFLRKK